MKSVNVSQVFTNKNRLNREIKADLTIGSKYLYFTSGSFDYTFFFDDSFSSSDETYFRFTFLENFVDENNDYDFTPKIYSLVSPDVAKTYFHDIDYVISCDLYPKRTMIKGEVTKVEWFSDQELTNKIIEVNIVYTRDAFGFAIHRTTTRKWLMSNGQFHEDFKITNKKYTINVDEQITEGKKRRENIVNHVQLPTLQFMLETMQGTQTQILLTGREFMDRFSLQFKNFIDNSSSITNINDPNYGKKTVVVAFEEAAASTDTWLNNYPQSLGGNITILQYLSSEFTI